MEKAIEVVRKRWPQVWAAIENVASDEVEHVTDTPAPTLQARGVHLTSVFDRKAEARMQAARVPPDATEACVYGLALGDLQRHLLASKALKKMSVVVLDTLTARLSLQLFDHEDWIDDPRVELVLAQGETTLRRPFVLAPACLKLAGPDASTLTGLLRRDLDMKGVKK